MPDIDKFRFSIDRGGTFTDVYAEVPGEKGYRVAKTSVRRSPQLPRRPPARASGESWKRFSAKPSCRTVSTRPGSNGFAWAPRWPPTRFWKEKAPGAPFLSPKGSGTSCKSETRIAPRIFDLEIQKPDLLYEEVVEVDERLRILKDGEAGT